MLGDVPEIPEVVDEDELVGLVERKYDEGVEARRPFERDAYLNTAFVLGKQWADYDEIQRAISTPLGIRGRIRLTDNHLIVVYKKLLARFVGIKPTVYAVPEDSTDKAKSGASVGTKLLKSIWYNSHMLSKMLEVASYMILHGSAWIKVHYDTNKGPKAAVPVIDPATEQQALNAETATPEVEEKPAGEIDCSVLGIFDVVFDPAGLSLDGCRWVICEAIRSTEYVEETYGVTLEEEKGVYSGTTEYYVSRIQGRKSPEVHGAVKVKEYWERPCKDYPRGRKITTANGKLLDYQSELPYIDEAGSGIVFPIVQFNFIKLPNRFYGWTVLDTLRSLQKAYNFRVSQISENATKIGNPKLLRPVEARVPANKFNDQVSEVIDYQATSGAAPAWLVPPPLPSYVFEDAMRMKSEIYEISGVMDLSHVEPGSKTGVGLAYVQEDLESQHNAVVQGLEESLEILGAMMLKMAAKEYVISRTIKIPGKAVETAPFVGEMLNGQSTVMVRMGSGLPQNRIARQQFAMGIWQAGLLKDPKEALSVMDFEENSEFIKDFRIDEAQSEEENEELARGIGHTVNHWDNHPIHIQIHNNYRKKSGYADLSPSVHEAFELHVAQHTQLLMLQMQAQGASLPVVDPNAGVVKKDGNQPVLGRGQRQPEIAETRSGTFPGGKGSSGGETPQ